jgi:hypothetical protein
VIFPSFEEKGGRPITQVILAKWGKQKQSASQGMLTHLM